MQPQALTDNTDIHQYIAKVLYSLLARCSWPSPINNHLIAFRRLVMALVFIRTNHYTHVSLALVAQLPLWVEEI